MTNKKTKKEIHSELLYDRVRARRDLIYFASIVLPTYDWSAPHHIYVMRLLQNYDIQDDRPYSRLMVSLPPRVGKSTMCAQIYPAWIMMRDPSAEVVIASYTASLASSHLREVRRIMASDEYIRLLGYDQRTDRSAVTRQDILTTDQKGYVLSVGVGGSLNGKGATHLIIDDPIGSRADAESSAMSDALWHWYTWVAARRLAPQGRIVIDHTRWCDHDLIGRLLMSPQAEDWQYVRIPAICDDTCDPLGRNIGESIWPSRWTAKAYNEIAKEDHYAYTTMYQQIPISDTSAYIQYDWLDIRDNLLFNKDLAKINIQDRYRVWDLAYTSSHTSDYSATCVCTISSDGHNYISDIEMLKMDYPQLKKIIIEYGNKEQIPIYMECNGPQAGIFSDIANSLLNNKLLLRKLDTSKSKNTRVLLAADEIKSKNVTIYTTKTNHHHTVTQLTKYDGRPSTSSSHDDIVDVIAHAICVSRSMLGNKQSIYIAQRKTGDTSWL